MALTAGDLSLMVLTTQTVRLGIILSFMSLSSSGPVCVSGYVVMAWTVVALSFMVLTIDLEIDLWY